MAQPRKTPKIGNGGSKSKSKPTQTSLPCQSQPNASPHIYPLNSSNNPSPPTPHARTATRMSDDQTRLHLTRPTISSLPPFKSAAERNSDDVDGSYFTVMNLIETSPIQALGLLTNGIALCHPPKLLQKLNTSAMVFTMDGLAFIFDCIRDSVSEDSISAFPRPAVSYFKEMFALLWQIRTLVESCSNGSKIAVSIMTEHFSTHFHKIIKELSDMLLFFPWLAFRSIDGARKLEKLMNLIRQGCDKSVVFVDKADLELRKEIVGMIEEIEDEVFPARDRIEKIFQRLEVAGFEGQMSEIKRLETEFNKRGSSMCKKIIRTSSVANLINYCKFVFFQGTWADSNVYDPDPATDWIFPMFVRCPITKAVMRNPVIMENGETFDQANIERWIAMGNTTCPVTAEKLEDTSMTRILPVKKLIEKWSKQLKVSLRPAEKLTEKMRAKFLAEKLFLLSHPSPDQIVTHRIIDEIKEQVGTNEKLSAAIGEAGAFPLLLGHLLLLHNGDRDTQKNAMEAIYILSYEESNKARVMEPGGGFGAIYHVLKYGLTWEARGLAAATMYCLSTVEMYKKRMKQGPRVVEELVKVMREAPVQARHGALAGILWMGSEKEKLREVLLLEKANCTEQEIVEVVLSEPVIRTLLWDLGRRAVSRRLRQKAGLILQLCSLWSAASKEKKNLGLQPF